MTVTDGTPPPEQRSRMGWLLRFRGWTERRVVQQELVTQTTVLPIVQNGSKTCTGQTRERREGEQVERWKVEREGNTAEKEREKNALVHTTQQQSCMDRNEIGFDGRLQDFKALCSPFA